MATNSVLGDTLPPPEGDLLVRALAAGLPDVA
jgi:hypothetical protein